MLSGNTRDLFNFITTRLKATASEKLVVQKFLENVDGNKLQKKKSIEKINFKAVWRLYKLIEFAPNEAEKLLQDAKDERWFDREVIQSLRGAVYGLKEETEEDEEEKKKRKMSPLPNVIKQGAGIIVPFTTTVSTGQTPSLGPTNVFGEESEDDEMSIIEALHFAENIK